MSPSFRRPAETVLPAGRASVAVLLYIRQQEICTIFIRRTEYDGVHSGQISFPGGMHEYCDDSLIITVLRECEEEIGISRNSLNIIGRLTELHVPISNVDILPVVAIVNGQPLFVPNPEEVEFIIEARLKDLANPLNIKRKMIRIGDFEIETPYYDINNHHIWGATAMILSEFLEVVKKTIYTMR
ncbi:MAG: CoA pyrophosphatase [Bacteroidales bacterium]|nr:CoA pyrophosphatase [Bacteroidales bacterium]